MIKKIGFFISCERGRTSYDLFLSNLIEIVMILGAIVFITTIEALIPRY